MPRRSARQSVSRQERRNQENKSPRCQEGGFNKFPTINGLERDGQADQKAGFPIAEKTGITDNQIAEDQQDEQKDKEQKKEPFGQERAQGGKVIEKPQAMVEKHKRNAQVSHHEQSDGQCQGRRSRVDGFEPPPALQGIDPHQQPQGPDNSGAVLRHAGIFKQTGALARQNRMTNDEILMTNQCPNDPMTKFVI